MCGITGQVSFLKQVEPECIRQMNRKIAHRGPDDEGYYFSSNAALPSVGLGHRRLSIIDLSAKGHQPMPNEDSSCWIVFNGEIYNFIELRKELTKKGHLFKSDTDTEVLLHLYGEYGTDCLHRLRGMFAFAIWDERKKRLFAARDRVGKKPFYYLYKNDNFYFASEINPLYDVPGHNKEIDYTALDLYFTYSYIPSPHTIMRAIRKLPPAHFLIVEKGKIQIKRYWQLNFSPKIDVSFHETKQLLLEKIEEATRIRLNSDVPLGCFLSGGVDSSLVVAMMAKLSPRAVRTFSIGFQDKRFDETQYARKVAELFKTDHQEFIVEPQSVDVLPELVEHYGEPFGDASALPTWYLSKLTKEHVTVVLNGDGGDELFAGYNWYATALGINRFSDWLPSFLISAIWGRLKTLEGEAGISRKIYRLLELADKKRPYRFADLRSQLNSSLKQSLYSDFLLNQVKNQSDTYLADIYYDNLSEDELDRMLYVDSMTYLPEELLVKVDRATMAHALEGRSPFLDHELMELAASMPSRFKYRYGKKKYILKKTIKSLFPPRFLDRPKSGFSVPLQKWFGKELEIYAFEQIRKGPLGNLPLLKMEFIPVIFRENKNGLKDHGDLIWRLLVLSLWLSKYI